MAVDQLSTIDSVRVLKTVGTLSSKEIIQLKAVIKETSVD